MPPPTLPNVAIAAKRQARRGRASAIGISNASGGMGKKLASAKAMANSHQGAKALSDSAITRS